MLQPKRRRFPYQSRMRRLKSRIGFFGALLLLCYVIMAVKGTFSDGGTASSSSAYRHTRKLNELSLMTELDGHGCYEDSRMGGAGIIIWLLGTFYTFFGLAVVCDDYFVDSLERISIALDLSDDVAGATFMAAGSSAPELFTSLIGVFFTSVEDNPGPGTIVGSAVFNITVIIGVTALAANQELELDWWPLARDSAYYTLSIILLIIAFKTGSDHDMIEWWEGLYLWLAYFGYIGVMKYNSRIVRWINARREGQIRDEHEKMTRSNMDSQAPLPYQRFRGMNPRFRSIYRQGVEAVNRWQEEDRRKTIAEADGEKEAVELQKTNSVKFKNAGKAVVLANRFAEVADQAAAERDKENNEGADDEEEEDRPKTKREWFFAIIAAPWLFMFKYTIPNSAKPRWAKWYMVTFSMSILWIGIISFFMVDFAAKMGECMFIPANVMGLTFLAAGTSVPDTFSSVLVARDGKGDMAVSNAIGSNVFDILLGLGFPWFLFTLSQGGKGMCMNTGGILVYTLILISVLIGFIAALMKTGFKLNRTVGYVLFVIYVAFITYALVDAFEGEAVDADFEACLLANP